MAVEACSMLLQTTKMFSPVESKAAQAMIHSSLVTNQQEDTYIDYLYCSVLVQHHGQMKICCSHPILLDDRFYPLDKELLEVRLLPAAHVFVPFNDQSFT